MAVSPERQCVGCGKRGPQDGFVRLCVAEVEDTAGGRQKVVRAGRALKGRGAYLCGRQACLDRAVQRRAFQRAFRATVVVDDEQIREAVRTAEAGD